MILDSLAEGIVTVDDQGHVMGINRAACEILEVEKYQAIHTDCSTLLGEQSCRSATVICEAIRGNRPVHDVQLEARMRSGREKTLLFRTNVLRDSEARPWGSVVVLCDVTELQALKEYLARRYRLHNIVEKSTSMREILRLVEEVADSEATVPAVDVVETLEELRVSPEVIRRILHSAGWNVAKAARRLHVSRTTLYKRIRQLGLKRSLE